MAKAMSDKKITSPSAESLAASAAAARSQGSGRGTPPVHLWDPPFCGDIDMRIARDGRWYYEGSSINRPAMVRLFAGILKLEAGRYYLVTPVEKVGITVEDAPFVAVDMEARGAGEAQHLQFETNVGDLVQAGPDAPIRVARDDETGEPRPYVMVRAGLEARIDRKSFYRLVEIGQHHEGWFGVWSGGAFFPMIPSEEMAET